MGTGARIVSETTMELSASLLLFPLDLSGP